MARRRPLNSRSQRPRAEQRPLGAAPNAVDPVYVELPGTESGTVKVTPLAEYPGKGRGTGGVRCHKFLKNEDQIYFAKFVGTDPKLFDEAEKEITGSVVDAKRDGTGKKLKSFVAGAN